MRRLLPKPHANDYEPNTFSRTNNIQVSEDSERGLAILKIYGSIDEPEEYIEELSKLDLLSKKFDVLEITLNSPGGNLNTTVDITSIITKFNYIVTIGKGEVASAAFMLWTMGDIRVVTDYSMYMAHRESYGMYGKTSEHRDAAVTFGKVYEEMFEQCFGDLLTDKEKNIAERSETWISYKDLLDRPGVISYDDYIAPKNPYSISELYTNEDGKMFMYDAENDFYRTVKVEFTDEAISDMTEYLYGVTDIVKIPKDTLVDVKEPLEENVKLEKTKKITKRKTNE